MQLPRHLSLEMMQTRWASILDPVIANPVNAMNILTGVLLKSGTNVINHGLGQTQQGWVILDINGAAAIYRNAPFNASTLSLSCNATVTVNIGVY